MKKAEAAEEVSPGRRDVVKSKVKILFWSCCIFETLIWGSPAGSENACLEFDRAVRGSVLELRNEHYYVRNSFCLFWG